MTLERFFTHFEILKEIVPSLECLSMYATILDDLERFSLEEQLKPIQMCKNHLAWCKKVSGISQSLHITYQSHWRLQLLPGLMEHLGTFFSNCLDNKTLLSCDATEITLMGCWLAFHFEKTHKHPSPNNFNYYAYIRSMHADIEKIGQERDALRVKASRSVKYHDAYEAISNKFKKECQKYWGEASVEKKRLMSEAHSVTIEKLVLTASELNRVKQDIDFILDDKTTKEAIHKRFKAYRSLNIVSGE